MNPEQNPSTERLPQNPVVHHAIQLLALALLLVWCFKIIEPFITLLVWGSVLAVTLYPLHKMLRKKLKDRNGLSATIITVLLLLLIIGPAIWLMLATVDEFKELGKAYRAGEISIPPPTEKVKSWPLIGEPVYGYWAEASKDLSEMVSQHREEVKSVLLKLFGLMRSTGKGILLFTLSIIVGGVLLAYAKSA